MHKRILIIFMLLGSQLAAQNKHDYQWLLGYGEFHDPYYGTYLLDFSNNMWDVSLFSKTPNLVLDFNRTTFSDDFGKLRYITAGCRIYDPTGKVIQNGYNINEGKLYDALCNSYVNGVDISYYPADFSSLFLDWPNKDSTLYITNNITLPQPGIGRMTNKVYYKIINNKGNNGKGSASELKLITMPDNVRDQHMMSCRHANGLDWWIIIPGWVDDRWYRILLDENGLHEPEYQELGWPKDSTTVLGQSVFSPDGSKYAYVSSKSNGVWVFDFNRFNGLMSNPQKYTYYEYPDIYYYERGVSFSPNNQYLYVSASKFLYQFDLKDQEVQGSLIKIGETDGFKDSIPPHFEAYLHGQQLAPDGKIYIFPYAPNQRFVHVINKPDMKGFDCAFKLRGIESLSFDAWSGPNMPHYRMDVLTSISEPIRPWPRVTLSPNPCTDFVILNVKEKYPKLLRMTITDVNGKSHKSGQVHLDNGFTTIDVRNIPPGSYFMTLMDGEGSQEVVQFVKQ